MENLTHKFNCASLIMVCTLFFSACGPDRPDAPSDPDMTPSAPSTPDIQFEVVKKYPHDITAFTEGFLFYNDKLLESTGSPDNQPQTRSTIGEVDLETGKLNIKAEIDRKIYFGEGIVVLNDKIYQLTWQNQTGFVYDARTYKRIGQFHYSNKEGWGLTTDGKHLIMSDGTYNLTWLDPENFSVIKTIPVSKDGYGVDYINELEYINGFIYANVWMSNVIIKIDPETGRVAGQMDLTDLYRESRMKNPQIGEMNGIAYDPKNDRVLVTGKFWPDIYEIRFQR
jgi:glutaminyl-peptide cyclotransferase